MVIPIGAEITPADELMFVLCEIIKLEAEWQDYREIYIARFDFDLDKVMAIFGDNAYIDEERFLNFASKVQVSPSSKQIKLFFERFGQNKRVDVSVVKSLISAQDERTNTKAELRDGMSPECFEAVGLWLKCLLRCLFAQNELKVKLRNRNVNIMNAFQTEFGSQLVHENLLRERLLARNITSRSRDLKNLLYIVSKGKDFTFSEVDLEEFLRPVDLYSK